MLAYRNPLFDAFFAPYQNEARHTTDGLAWNSFSPAADVRETKQAYLIDLDVPGLAENEIELVVENRHLTVKGERKPVESASFTRQERPFGRFERLFHLPEDADGGRAEARVRNGVLTVEIPKVESARARSIAIKTE